MSTLSTVEPPANGGQAPDSPSGRRDRVREPLSSILGRYSALILAFVFIVTFGLLRPNTFLSVSTFQITASESVVTAVLALAFLVPLAAGVFDLSIGAILGLSLVIMNWFGINHPGVPMWVVSIGVILLSMIVGLLNGLIVVRLHVNSLIATLGTSQILAAAALYIANNRPMNGAFTSEWLQLGNGKVQGIPNVVIYLVVLSLVVWFVLEHTPVGRRLFAVGGNPDAARLAGLSVNRLTYGALVASAAIAGFGGVVYSMKIGTYNVTAGPGLLFPALAAVFFGASQFVPRPNVWGTIVAFFALAIGVKGLQLTFGPGTFWIQPLFQGVALIIAVSMASREVGQTRKSRRQNARAEPEVGVANEPVPAARQP